MAEQGASSRGWLAGRVDAAQVLNACVLRCRQARDGRGRWRAERIAAQALGGDATAQRCGAAARHLGEWLAAQKGAAM